MNSVSKELCYTVCYC